MPEWMAYTWLGTIAVILVCFDIYDRKQEKKEKEKHNVPRNE